MSGPRDSLGLQRFLDESTEAQTHHASQPRRSTARNRPRGARRLLQLCRQQRAQVLSIVRRRSETEGRRNQVRPQLDDAGILTRWVRSGMCAGHVGYPWEGRFPRYVWHRADGTCYEARLVNRELGRLGSTRAMRSLPQSAQKGCIGLARSASLVSRTLILGAPAARSMPRCIRWPSGSRSTGGLSPATFDRRRSSAPLDRWSHTATPPG